MGKRTRGASRGSGEYDDLDPDEMDEAGKVTSKGLAVLIVDALLRAGVVRAEDVEHAIEVAREEIEVRKAMGG